MSLRFSSHCHEASVASAERARGSGNRVGEAAGRRIMRGPACSGKESEFHPRCGEKPRCVLARGVRPAAAEGCQRAEPDEWCLCRGSSPGRDARRRAPEGCPAAPPPCPAHRAAPARRGGRRSTPGSRQETRSSASASWPCRRRRRGRRGPAGTKGPRPPPASLQAPPLQRFRPVSRLPHAPLQQLPGAGAGGAHRCPLPFNQQTPPPVNFRSHRRVLGTTGVGDVISAVSSAYPAVGSPVGARGSDCETFL